MAAIGKNFLNWCPYLICFSLQLKFLGGIGLVPGKLCTYLLLLRTPRLPEEEIEDLKENTIIRKEIFTGINFCKLFFRTFQGNFEGIRFLWLPKGEYFGTTSFCGLKNNLSKN